MRSLIAALCGFFCLAPKLAIALDGGSIAGIVTRIDSAQPIAGARVILLASTGATVKSLEDDTDRDDDAPKPRSWAAPARRTLAVGEDTSLLVTTETGPDGRFAFTDLRPGTYRLVVFADGYVPREYGQRVADGAGSPIVLAGGESVGPVAIRLTPTGSLEGHVQEIGGELISNIPIYLWRYRYASDGRRLVQVVAAARTDDRGAFRIFWIPPGRYFLSSGGPGEGSSVGGAGHWRGISHFPGVSNSADAAVIHVLPSSEQTLNWLLPAHQGFQIHARLQDPMTGMSPGETRVSVRSQGFAGGSRAAVGQEQIHYDPASGLVEVSDLAPGVYQVDIWVRFPEPTPPPAPAQNETGNPDEMNLEEIRVILRHSPRQISVMSTVVRIVDANAEAMDPDMSEESPELPAIQGKVATSAGVTPRSAEELKVVLHHASNEPKTFDVADDGTFEIPYSDDPTDCDAIVAGIEYRVTVARLPRGWYVHSATLDGADVLSAAAPFNQAASLEIVLSAQGGEVMGVVQRQDGTPASNVLVVLVPDRMRARAELFARTITDSEGRFSMAGVAPGEYALQTWVELEANAFFDPVLLEQVEAHGTRVHVTESSRQVVNIQMVPLEVTQ